MVELRVQGRRDTTAAALANARGGELFLGVTDDRNAVGTTVTSDGLTRVLKQEKANPGIGYVVDLNQAVRQPPLASPLGPRGRSSGSSRYGLWASRSSSGTTRGERQGQPEPLRPTGRKVGTAKQLRGLGVEP